MIYTRRTQYTVEPLKIVDFELRDKKGRRVGAQVVLTVETLAPAPEGEYGYTQPPGTYFCFRPSATRNGKPFGAIQTKRFFATFEERDAEVKRYFDAAVKRAYKQFA